MLLARLLRLDDIVSVTVPSVQREAARDLVRAREDVRGDLMRARHRVSKLLLRQGIVYYGGHAWTGTHLVWLRKQHFDAPGLQLAFDAEHEAVLQAEAAGTGSTRPSRRWPPTATTPQSCADWGAYAGSRR
jgi:transposase